MVTPVLCQVVELLSVLIDRMVPLAQIQELRKLVVHCARLHVVTTEGNVELIPWYMVICGQCYSVRCRPGPNWTS
jgi:hypothetical protein